MEFLNTIINIIIALLVFSAIIFFHEFGHFLFAKLNGVYVNEFAIGMGPKIISKTVGDTTYALRLFPIGGFVAMEGEDEDSADARSFTACPVWKRIIITAAGGIMNLILGLIVVIARHYHRCELHRKFRFGELFAGRGQNYRGEW